MNEPKVKAFLYAKNIYQGSPNEHLQFTNEIDRLINNTFINNYEIVGLYANQPDFLRDEITDYMTPIQYAKTHKAEVLLVDSIKNLAPTMPDLIRLTVLAGSYNISIRTIKEGDITDMVGKEMVKL